MWNDNHKLTKKLKYFRNVESVHLFNWTYLGSWAIR